MDPKTLPNLDPKLKEVYERVMGSSVTQTPPVPVVPPAQTQPPVNSAPPSQPTPPPQPNLQSPPPSTQKPLNNTDQELHATQVFNPHLNSGRPKLEASPAPASVSAVKTTGVETKGKSKIGAPVLALMGIVFLILYAIFWVSFFKVRLPF